MSDVSRDGEIYVLECWYLLQKYIIMLFHRRENNESITTGTNVCPAIPIYAMSSHAVQEDDILSVLFILSSSSSVLAKASTKR